MEAWTVWLLIAAFAFIVEAITVGLVSIWFGCAALVTSGFSLIFRNIFPSDVVFLVCQIILFALLSALFLYLTKPLMAKFVKTEKTNADSIIGKEALVLEDIDNLNGTGSVKIGSATWSAKSSDGAKIEKGKVVTVKEIAGVSAIVSVPEICEVE